ncbi:PaaX family transcriptional regulator [Thermus filiformis]|uniref:Uncharacterized protein n=1 Tax=Thermus filiformis TaxID=276 RepID=A0A0A2WSV6_THEFI|nr:PaaX family transcriptional regulator C-terminal domain-containing protein [Thermus filiformis]KGQ22913.1 hypothetical protein THFILI_06230 [Thermus filiformis]
MRARSTLFTLYMEYVFPDRKARVKDLVRWMRLLGFSEPAVRAALSRSAKRGWVLPLREGREAFYALSDRVFWQVKVVRSRLYEPLPPFSGRLSLLLIENLGRKERDRFKSELALLGYGSLMPGVFLSPNGGELLPELLAFYGRKGLVLRVEGSLEEARELVGRVFPLEEAQARYQELLARPWEARSPEEAFRLLTELVHEARKLLFLDPGLPPELAPTGYLGPSARERFLSKRAELKALAAPILSPR